MRASLLLSVVWFAAVVGCRRDTHPQAEPAAISTATMTSASGGPSVAAAPSVAPAVSATPVTSASAASPAASASSLAYAPAPIAAAEVGRAKQYVNGLARGRKATKAKDYAAAVGHFNQALAAEPGDARVLSERGYAHLLAGDFDAAMKDLEAAEKRASNSDLLRQILFNRATIAEKRGDNAMAEALRAQRDKLRSASRSKNKDCELSIARPGTLPTIVKTFREAWNEIKNGHFRHWEIPADTLESPVIDEHADEATIRKALIGNASTGDGAWSVITESSQLRVNHVLFVRGKQIFVFAGLGGFQAARCPLGDEPPKVVAGDVPIIEMESEYLELGYMCTKPNGIDFIPCDEITDGTPVQSYCYWTESKFRTFVLDPKTLAIAIDIEETVQARDNQTFQAAQPRSVLTFQSDAVLVTGCGVERREPLSQSTP